MVQGAVYDAVNAIDRGHRPYLAEPPARRSDSKDAAAATAAFRVLVGLFPAQQPTLQPLYDTSLAAVADTPPGAKAAGIAIGEAAAAAMLAARANDGRFGPFTPVIGTTPGVWRPTPPLFAPDPAPWVGNVRPFLVPRRRDAPHRRAERPDEPRLREGLQRDQERSARCTARPAPPDETDAAIFWQDHAFALWNRVFRTLAADRHLDIVDSARLFASENLAAADAAIGCWNNKYHWNFWRPITAIREADERRKPRQPRPTRRGRRCSIRPRRWPRRPRSSRRRSPSTPRATTARPARSCGRCSTSSAPTGSRFSASSNKSGTTRTFHRFSDALQENIDARVWAGIHFRTADVAGSQARQEGRALPPQALLPTRSLTAADIRQIGGRGPRSLATVGVRANSDVERQLGQAARAAAAALAGRAPARRGLPAGDEARRRCVPRAARRRARGPRLRGRACTARPRGTGWRSSPASGWTTWRAGLAGGPGFPHQEARAVSATCGGIRVVSVYVPNGREPGSEHYEYKLAWLASLRDDGGRGPARRRSSAAT